MWNSFIASFLFEHETVEGLLRFERHTIRGLNKMRMFLTVTFIVYMTMVKAKVELSSRTGVSRSYLSNVIIAGKKGI